LYQRDREIIAFAWPVLAVAGTGSSSVVLAVDHTLAADFAAVQARASQLGSDVVITFDIHDTLTLKDVQVGSLHASDFVIV
jgi:serralysin